MKPITLRNKHEKTLKISKLDIESHPTIGDGNKFSTFKKLCFEMQSGNLQKCGYHLCIELFINIFP